MNYFKYLERKIGEVVSKNEGEFIIYPFGERGALTKAILNTLYNVKEKVIIDNVLCEKYKNIYSLEYLSNMSMDNCKVLITSDHEIIYEELRERLYKFVEKEKCIELLPVPLTIETKRSVPKAVDKMIKEGMMLGSFYYHPKKTKSEFYLPFLPMECQQRGILLSDDYYDRRNLERVLKYFENGIIGESVAEGKGIVLDIGANIGNHTLFFCNEYNAKMVYCYEPVGKTFAILTENVRLNHLEERVKLHQFGLGEREERRSIGQYNLMNIGGTGLVEDKDGGLEIKCLDELGIEEPIVLMKIDVEGMERKVLRGGLELIRKNMPYIMIESEANEGFPETREILCSIGYTYEQLGIMDWLFYPV